MIAERPTPRLKQLYDDEIAAKVKAEFNLANVHEVPRVEKVVVNCGVGRFLENQKLPQDFRDEVIDTLTRISGQKPVIVKAKRSVSNFKVREGAPSGIMVTMRRERMWNFLDRLMNLAIPRIKDFRGVKRTSFDPAGNYAFGLTEQAVWPEVNSAAIKKTHGMNVNIVVANSNPRMSLYLLEQLGMPFQKLEN